VNRAVYCLVADLATAGRRRAVRNRSRRLCLDRRHNVSGVLVRATAVGQDAERNVVLAGDPKMFRLLCNTNLNMNIPSRGSEEERIRIPCGYGLILTDIINKTEIGKYVSVCVRY